ncbi:MAG: hypothetical protein RL616_231 [Verrucomicrobiota bacterium]
MKIGKLVAPKILFDQILTLLKNATMANKLIPPNHSGSIKTWNINFTVNISIAILLTLASIGIILLHGFCPQLRDELSFALAVIGGASAIYLGFYTSRSLVVNVERQKQQNAFELLRDLYRVDTSSIIILIRKNFGSHVSAKDHCQKIEDDKDLHKSILTVLGVFEDTSLAIQSDVACEKILYNSLGFLVPWIFDNLKPFIEYRRNKDNDKTIWIEIEKLAVSWKEKKSINDGSLLE